MQDDLSVINKTFAENAANTYILSKFDESKANIIKQIDNKNMNIYKKIEEGTENLEEKIGKKAENLWNELEYTMLELEGQIDILRQNPQN